MAFFPYFPFGSFLCADIGDKYSVFRQLEPAADKKPVGKNLPQSISLLPPFT